MIQRTTSTRTGPSRRNSISSSVSFFRGPQCIVRTMFTAASKHGQEGPADLLVKIGSLPAGRIIRAHRGSCRRAVPRGRPLQSFNRNSLLRRRASWCWPAKIMTQASPFRSSSLTSCDSPTFLSDAARPRLASWLGSLGGLSADKAAASQRGAVTNGLTR
jgi:hypothetical protein